MSLPVRKVELSPPSLEELAQVIAAGLQANFEHSSATVEPCPDLRQAPFHLAGQGLNGSTRVVDIGDPTNLMPPNLSKKYDLLQVSKLIDLPQERGFLLGAGAGPFYVLGVNAELAPNVAYHHDQVNNHTHYTKIGSNDRPHCQKINASTGFALMANLFGSEGLPGPALHIKASSRIGAPNFTDTIQAAIKSQYGDKDLISIGGTFVIKRGRANLHVMGDFPDHELKTREDIDNWLRRFEFEAPLVCLSVLHTGGESLGLGLRTEHTHCFSVGDGEGTWTEKGGHYHFDVDETKAVVEYEGWFNTAGWVYRVDQPGARR